MPSNPGQCIIQLVGPDMTGKTEIARALAQRLSIPYFKASSEHNTYLNDRDSFVQQLRYADPRLVDFLRQTGYSVVMDRGFPCECAYSRVLGRKTDWPAIMQVDQAYGELNAAVIICFRSSYEGIVDDLDKGITQEILERLHDEYINFSTWTRCHVMLLNVDDEDLNREVEDIVDWLPQIGLAAPSKPGDSNYNRRVARGRCWGCCQENCGFRDDCGCSCHGGI